VSHSETQFIGDNTVAPLDPHRQLVGTWRLLAWESRDADGALVYPMGNDVLGYITFTSDGHMSGHLMKRGRVNFASGDVLRPSAAEAQEASAGYVAYCGTYEITGEGTLVSHVELSLAPNWIGTDQKRLFELNGDQLTLSTPPLYAGGRRSSRLIWERFQPEV
jgi:hypothetical protein